MTVTVLGFDGGPFDQNSLEISGRFIKTYCLFKLSGNYPTGGDLLDLTNGGGTPAAPNIVPAAENRGLASIDIRPVSKVTTSLSAVGGSYQVITPGGVVPVPTAGLSVLRLKLYLITNAEYANGAYGADALGDLVIAELTWAR